MRQVIQHHNEPNVDQPMKQSVMLRLSKNVTNGKRYDVYLVPLPVGIARALELPIGLVMEMSYDPKDRNKLTLRWENGESGNRTIKNNIEQPSMGQQS